jgi:hypothetical protein
MPEIFESFLDYQIHCLQKWEREWRTIAPARKEASKRAWTFEVPGSKFKEKSARAP